MPHLILEISPNLPIDDEAELLTTLNTALWQSGQFKAIADIKSRIHRTNTGLIGLGDDGEHFALAQLLIMAGRSDEIKADLVQRVMNALQAYIGKHSQNVQYAVDVRDLSAVYQKTIQ